MDAYIWLGSFLKTLNLKTEPKMEGQCINLLGSDDVRRMELTHDRV
jgi:hypothetical protein